MCPNGEGHGVGSWDEISHLCTLDFGDLDLIYLISKGGGGAPGFCVSGSAWLPHN